MAYEVCGDGNVYPPDADRDWARGVIALAKEKTTEKADEGTVIHDALERYHEDPFTASEKDHKLYDAIRQCILENTGLELLDNFISEARFCNTEYGYAGMCDLHTAPEVKTPWVIDYKSKDDSAFDKSIRGYPEQGQQLVAYRAGLLGVKSKARIANIFISRDEPAEGEPWKVSWYEHKDPDYLWACFLTTLAMWQMDKKFGPIYDKWLSEHKLAQEQ